MSKEQFKISILNLMVHYAKSVMNYDMELKVTEDENVKKIIEIEFGALNQGLDLALDEVIDNFIKNFNKEEN